MCVATELGLAVGHDLFAVDDVFDRIIATDFHFDGHPLFAMECV